MILTIKEIQKNIRECIEKIKTKKQARKLLVDAGICDKKGNLIYPYKEEYKND